MFAELVNRIAEMAVNAAMPKVIHCDAEPDHLYSIATADGAIVHRSANADPRKHNAADLTAIVDFAQKASSPEIWYSRKGVVCYLDPSTRRDTVTLPLTLSRQLTVLQALESRATAHKQASFITLLRITLANAAPPNLLHAVRNLKFNVVAASAGNIQHGKASIGRTLEAELTGSSTIPEETGLVMPVFEGFLAQRNFLVKCAIEIDAQAETLALHPLPGQIEQAIREAEDAIGAMLREMLAGDESIPVLYGTP